MRLEIDDRCPHVVDIVLSERNLLTMLTKLYTPASNRMIVNGDVGDALRDKGILYGCLKVEPDDVHYASETRRSNQGTPGEMHADTERVLALIKDALMGEQPTEVIDP